VALSAVTGFINGLVRYLGAASSLKAEIVCRREIEEVLAHG
jgi:hypothetical protein